MRVFVQHVRVYSCEYGLAIGVTLGGSLFRHAPSTEQENPTRRVPRHCCKMPVPLCVLPRSSYRTLRTARVPQAQDLPVYFGDAGSPAVLHLVGAERAKCAVIALDSPGVALTHFCVVSLTFVFTRFRTAGLGWLLYGLSVGRLCPARAVWYCQGGVVGLVQSP